MLEAAETRGEFLSQKIVVQTGTNQFRGDRCRQWWWIEMGKGSGMGWLVGAVHHKLQITQECIKIGTVPVRNDFRQRTQWWKGPAALGGTDPVTEKIGGSVQEFLQNRITGAWTGKRGQPIR